MRSFYIDDNDTKTREYLVMVENIKVSNEMKGIQIISACTSLDLKNKICSLYGFHESFHKYIQLWSGPIGAIKRIRLDILDTIPNECDTIYVRGVNK